MPLLPLPLPPAPPPPSPPPPPPNKPLISSSGFPFRRKLTASLLLFPPPPPPLSPLLLLLLLLLVLLSWAFLFIFWTESNSIGLFFPVLIHSIETHSTPQIVGLFTVFFFIYYYYHYYSRRVSHPPDRFRLIRFIFARKSIAGRPTVSNESIVVSFSHSVTKSGNNSKAVGGVSLFSDQWTWRGGVPPLPPTVAVEGGVSDAFFFCWRWWWCRWLLLLMEHSSFSDRWVTGFPPPPQRPIPSLRSPNPTHLNIRTNSNRIQSRSFDKSILVRIVYSSTASVWVILSIMKWFSEILEDSRPSFVTFVELFTPERYHHPGND